MLFPQITNRSSLRETISCLEALGTRRYHMGIRTEVARSTLAEANERRNYRIFEDTALAMIAEARIEVPLDAELRDFGAEIYALDSTTIDLRLKLFPWAHFRKQKAGIKAHTLLDVRTDVPVFIRITHSKTHDLHALGQIQPQSLAYCVMDKGYTDFTRLYRLYTAGAFFVTRAKANMDFRVRERCEVNAEVGVRSDQLIRLRGVLTKNKYPDTLRLISYTDPETKLRLKFMTNNLTLDAATIAMLYSKRWQIELFFKWVKQHPHIKAFFGTTPNAVRVQLWIAVIACLLVTRLKHRHGLLQNKNTILQILSVTILEKTPVIELFLKEVHTSGGAASYKETSLFDL